MTTISELIHKYTGVHDLSFGTLFFFIFLLTNSYTFLAILYAIGILVTSVYVHPFSEMKLTKEIMSYFGMGFLIVFFAIPTLYMGLSLIEPTVYLVLTLGIMQQVNQMVNGPLPNNEETINYFKTIQTAGKDIIDATLYKNDKKKPL